MDGTPTSVFLYLPISIYLILMAVALGFILKNRSRYQLFTTDYWRFIFTPGKALIFVAGVLALALPVSWLGLHSWDYPIAVFQPALTYLTAPWAVAVIYRFYKKKAKGDELYVAVCLMLFAGSWSVEIYLLIRDGLYMPDWLFNIPVGIVCYTTAGLIWNVKWRDGQGYFAFTEKES